MSKPPIDMTDEELLEAIRSATHTNYYVLDWIRELDRRDAKRRADHQTRIAYIATGAAGVSAVAALVALFAR